LISITYHLVLIGVPGLFLYPQGIVDRNLIIPYFSAGVLL
jgi:hypothetical protein